MVFYLEAIFRDIHRKNKQTNKQKTLMSKVTLVNIFELVTKGSHPKSKALTSVPGKIQFFPTM